MSEQIISIDRIEGEAVKAAAKFSSVNDACPYSFYSEAGQIFKKAFQRERLAIELRKQSSTKTLETSTSTESTP